jgi:lipid II:glycine glycyltransferase (peptidoglycan interpeptide bridge formation enzyme)
MHAENVWVLPLDKSENELLNQMRKTTRYLIRKASRDGVIIEKRTDKKAVDDFYKIYEETARREQFVPFSKDYIKNEFEVFNKTGNGLFLFGYLADSTGVEVTGLPTARRNFRALTGGKPRQASSSKKYLVSALILFTKSSAFYHQGASIHTKYPVPYLMQWEAIKESKKRGCQLYNFWGIAPNEDKNHPWSGLTMFKKGFGGSQTNYLPTHDLIISPKYYLTFCYEKLLRWKRRV